MTDYRIEHLPFVGEVIQTWGMAEPEGDDWPVVYTISADSEIYIGETVNAATRLQQHLHSPSKKHLKRVQIILNDKFNKSVCLDLESHLIKYFAADGTHRVLNGNAGISDSNYFNRESYRDGFRELFDMLVKEGLLSRSIPEIVNSNLFKFSPFKALNSEQAVAVSAVLERLLEQLSKGSKSQLVIQGDPGTGKTVVAIYLIKLLLDIPKMTALEAMENDSIFADFFEQDSRDALKDLKVGLVVPQQSLRKTIGDVFAQTPGLSRKMILTPFDVGKNDEYYDLLIVDEAHRLGQRANQSSGPQNKQFIDINMKLFGNDSKSHTQLDWLRAKSNHQLLLLDTAQSVRPADLPTSTTEQLLTSAGDKNNLFRLASQMRVTGGQDYIDFVQDLLSSKNISPRAFGNYDFKFFDSFAEMRSALKLKDEEFGLGRLLAGFAWPWKTKNNPQAIDIEIEGVDMVWNQTATDWINSPNSEDEVGSIHTIQGYDLNYAGVIIGKDLRFNPTTKSLYFDRDNYYDVKGRENNPTLGITYSDEDILKFVINIYRVLLTRGIRGTYVYICDENLRQHFRNLGL